MSADDPAAPVTPAGSGREVVLIEDSRDYAQAVKTMLDYPEGEGAFAVKHFTKLAEAFGLTGITVTRRSEVVPSVKSARNHKGGVVIDFQVEQEDSVYPMVPAGADLHAMIRRPSPIVETAADA